VADRQRGATDPKNLNRVMPAEGIGEMASDSSTTVVVVTGGDPLEGVALPRFPEGARVVAADSGVDRAQDLGLRVDLAVGDFDSVTPVGLATARDAGADVETHPAAKDATDLELALDAALALGPERIVVLGGHGGRLDHLLANALLLARPQLAGLEVVAQMGAARVTVIRDRAVLEGEVGDIVTLLPLHGAAHGVVTDGLLYPLRDEDLLPGTSRGVSNELTATSAVVTLREGTLLAVQPGQPGTHHLRTQP
jgi:thiamine pyrophosphokinase